MGISHLLDEPRLARAEALTGAVLLRLPPETFEETLRTSPTLAMGVIGALRGQLRASAEERVL